MNVRTLSLFDPPPDRRRAAVTLLAAAWLLFTVSLLAPVESANAWPIPWPFNSVGLWMILSVLQSTKSSFGPAWLSSISVPFMLMSLLWIGGLGRPSIAQRVFSLGLLSAWAFPIYFDFVLDGRARMDMGLMSPLWGYYLLAVSHTLAFVALQVGGRENPDAGNVDEWTVPDPSDLPRPLIAGRKPSIQPLRPAAAGRHPVEAPVAPAGADSGAQILKYRDPSAELWKHRHALTLAGRITPGVAIVLTTLIGAIELLDRRAGLGFHLPGVSTDQTLASFSWVAATVGFGGAGVNLFASYQRRTLLRPQIWLAVVANLSSAAVAILWLRWNGRL